MAYPIQQGFFGKCNRTLFTETVILLCDNMIHLLQSRVIYDMARFLHTGRAPVQNSARQCTPYFSIQSCRKRFWLGNISWLKAVSIPLTLGYFTCKELDTKSISVGQFIDCIFAHACQALPAVPGFFLTSWWLRKVTAHIMTTKVCLCNGKNLDLFNKSNRNPKMEWDDSNKTGEVRTNMWNFFWDRARKRYCSGKNQLWDMNGCTRTLGSWSRMSKFSRFSKR